MADQSGEKTEEATPHKLREAQKGQVAKSQDFTTGIVFALSVAVLMITLPRISSDLQAFVKRCFQMGLESPSAATITLLMSEGHMLILTIIMPLLGVAVVAAVMGNFIQFGFLFTTKPLEPEQKINPVEGAKNLISKKKLVQMLLSILKFSVVSYLVYNALAEDMKNVVRRADRCGGRRVCALGYVHPPDRSGRRLLVCRRRPR